ncbi:MAG: class I SAM-dependent methyltransferase, partial [Patescibacteria group bacterium]
MQYYTPKKIANEFNVNLKTPYIWIEKAKKGQNNLELAKVDNFWYVIVNEANRSELMKLAKNGRKHYHKGATVQTLVGSEFYQIFSLEEQLDIFSDLVEKRFFNLKYWYYNGGAKLWDEFYNTGTTPIKKIVSDLLKTTTLDVQFMTDNFEALNIIDLGCGNGVPAQKFIKKLATKVNSYRGVDISQSMLDIAKANIKESLPELRSEFTQLD